MTTLDPPVRSGRTRADRPVQDAVTEVVGDCATQWYPDLAGVPRIELRPLAERPACSLFLIWLHAGDRTRRILAKVRRDVPGASAAGVRSGRPRLRPHVPTAGELTAYEYHGLGAIETIAADTPSSFGAVRPLAHLPGHATLLMEYVDARTLRQAFLAESRLVPSWLPQLGGPGAAEPTWGNVGAWLRDYHDRMPSCDTAVRQPTRESVVERFEAYGDYLTERVGAGTLAGIASEGAELAAQVLPARLPLAVGHGDFAPRNMFVDGQGRVTGFDPMPRWRVPRHEDLCRFVVGLRLLGLQVHTRGAAYGAEGLDSREQRLLLGYFGTRTVPREELRCYQLLVVLDKWSALVDSAGTARGAGRRALGLAQRGTDAYIRDEAYRLLGRRHAAPRPERGLTPS